MRSVKQQRKNARGRTPKQTRRTTTAARPAPRQNFGKRMKFRNDPFTRAYRRARDWLSFRRPMLILTGWLLAFTIVAALFAGGYVANTIKAGNDAVKQVVADAGFGISAIHLAGNHRTPPRQILAALGFQPGQSIFDADVHKARARLMQLDWVADAQVHRRYPDTISVAITEKVPFALWRSANGLYVITREGGVITSKNVSEFSRLPLLAGAGAPKTGAELIDAISVRRAVSARVRIMDRISNRRWNLILDDGVTVKLPEQGWQKQLDVLENLIVDKAVLERDISEIDLRSPDNFFFMLRNGQKQQVTRGTPT